MAKQDKEAMDVLRFKSLYELMIRETTGGHRHFSIDKEAGKANYDRFLKVVRWCRVNRVEFKDFLDVLFSLRNTGKNRWAYPYLTYLASSAAFQTFMDRKRFISSVFHSTEANLHTYSPLNYERYFVNCFYNGVSLVQAAIDRDGLKEVGKGDYLLLLFLAFPEVFTPEFIVTHSRFFPILKEATAEIKSFIISEVAQPLERVRKEVSYRTALMIARASVEKKEKRRAFRMFGVKPYWEEAWQSLM